jgi:ABC-2 type transport system permease protein
MSKHNHPPTPALKRRGRDHWKAFVSAAWLGWQVESNWADPIVFTIYSVLRPISMALILLLMYTVISGGAKGDFFDYLYISNALYLIVMQSIANMSWTIFEDRENYRMLKYVFISPQSMMVHLLGRAMARILIGISTAIFLLIVGGIWMGVHINIADIQWGWLALYFIFGIMIMMSIGVMIAGIAMSIARNGEFIGEVMASMLLLFTATYFPPDILPGWLKSVTLAVPLTYWLEGMRRALVGGVLEYSPAVAGKSGPISPLLAQYSNLELLGILAASAAVTTVLGLYIYRTFEQRAKNRGVIDRVSGS